MRINLGKENSMSVEMKMDLNLILIKMKQIFLMKLMKKLQQPTMKVMMLTPNNQMG